MAEGVNKFVSWTLDIVKEIREIPARPKLRPRSSLPKAPDGMIWAIDEAKQQWCLRPAKQAKENEVKNEKVIEEQRAQNNDTCSSAEETNNYDNNTDGTDNDKKDTSATKNIISGGHLDVSQSIENFLPHPKKNPGKDHNTDSGKAPDKDLAGHLDVNQTFEHFLPHPKKVLGKDHNTDSRKAPDKDLALSTEGSDQFIEATPPTANNLNKDDSSEEKTPDEHSLDNEISSIIGSNDDQWELISEKSGSAIVISLSGSVSGTSFRSVSPSCNKFILTESTGEKYIDHVVLPTDTLQGLCLAYKISATRLRMENNFSGNSLQMAPKKLRIPMSGATKGMMIRTQDKSSKEFKLYAFLAEMSSVESVEARAYLDLANWDLEEALQSAREEVDWKLKGEESFEGESCTVSPIPVVVKPKSLTAQDIVAALPPFEGDGFEMQDVVKR